MSLRNEDLILLDTLCYYASFSNRSYTDSDEVEHNFFTVDDFVDCYNDVKTSMTTCFNDTLGLSDEDLGMSKILEHIQRDEQLKRLQIVYPYSYDDEGNKIGDPSTSSVCLVDPTTNERVRHIRWKK